MTQSTLRRNSAGEVIVTLIFAGLSQLAYAAPDDFLTVHYRFDSLAGNVAVDEANPDPTATPNDNGAIAGGITGEAGRFGNAIRLNGTNGSVNSFNSDVVRATSGATLMAWVKLDLLPRSPQDIASIITVSTSSARTGARVVLAIEPAGTIRVAGRSRDNEYYLRRSSSPHFSDNSGWIHVAGIIDFANDTIRIIVNGTQVGLQAGSTPFSSSVTDNTNSLALSVGSTGGVFEYLDGLIDEARIYRTALTPAEVAAIAAQAPPPPKPPTPDLVVRRIGDGFYERQARLQRVYVFAKKKRRKLIRVPAELQNDGDSAGSFHCRLRSRGGGFRWEFIARQADAIWSNVTAQVKGTGLAIDLESKQKQALRLEIKPKGSLGRRSGKVIFTADSLTNGKRDKVTVSVSRRGR